MEIELIINKENAKYSELTHFNRIFCALKTTDKCWKITFFINIKKYWYISLKTLLNFSTEIFIDLFMNLKLIKKDTLKLEEFQWFSWKISERCINSVLHHTNTNFESI